jgi:hypothetical protein
MRKSAPKDQGDEAERQSLIAEILAAIFGRRALDHVASVGKDKSLAGVMLKGWDALKHPRGKNGRFIEKNSAEAVSAAHDEVAKILKGPKTSETFNGLLEHLNLLTVKQLHDLKGKYKLSAAAPTRDELAAKLAERLGKSRMGGDVPEGETPSYKEWAKGERESRKKGEEKVNASGTSLWPAGSETDEKHVWRIQPVGADLHGQRSQASDESEIPGVFVFENANEIAAIDWMNTGPVELVKIAVDKKKDLFPTQDQEGVGLKEGRGKIVARATYENEAAISEEAERRQSEGWPSGEAEAKPSEAKEKGTEAKLEGVPKRISERWLSQQRTALEHTAKTLGDGSPNPAYASLEAEVSEAAAELERWKAFEGWVKTDLGMTLNAYPLRTKGQTYEPGHVFLKKDKATGRTEFLTKQAAWEKYVESRAAAEEPKADAEAPVEDSRPDAPPSDFATQFAAADPLGKHDLIADALRGQHGPEAKAKVEAALDDWDSHQGKAAAKHERVMREFGNGEAAEAEQAASGAKQPYEMTADEYADANAGKFDARHSSMDRSKAKKEHARIVADRVLNGQDVPAERIAEYPHLDMDKMRAASADVAAKMGQQKEVKQKLADARVARQKLMDEIKRGSAEAQAKHDAEALKETLSEYLDKRGVSESGKAKILAAKQGPRGYRTDPNTGATVELAGGDSWYMPHYNAVKDALAAGKPVPPEVLADYPDLAAKYAPKASETSGEKAPPVSPPPPPPSMSPQQAQWFASNFERMMADRPNDRSKLSIATHLMGGESPSDQKAMAQYLKENHPSVYAHGVRNQGQIPLEMRDHFKVEPGKAFRIERDKGEGAVRAVVVMPDGTEHKGKWRDDRGQQDHELVNKVIEEHAGKLGLEDRGYSSHAEAVAGGKAIEQKKRELLDHLTGGKSGQVVADFVAMDGNTRSYRIEPRYDRASGMHFVGVYDHGGVTHDLTPKHESYDDAATDIGTHLANVRDPDSLNLRHEKTKAQHDEIKRQKTEAYQKEREREALERDSRAKESSRQDAARASLLERAKQIKAKKGTYEINTGGARSSVPGYVTGEFGFRKPPGGRSWEITHVGSGLKVASVDSLEQAKAVAYAIGAKGNWKFEDTKRADRAALAHGASVVRMLKGEDWAGIMDAIGGEGQSERLSRAIRNKTRKAIPTPFRRNILTRK